MLRKQRRRFSATRTSNDALFVLTRIEEILAWETRIERERDTKFVELGRYLCEVRAAQYWRLDPLSDASPVPQGGVNRYSFGVFCCSIYCLIIPSGAPPQDAAR